MLMTRHSMLSKPLLRALIARVTDWTVWDEVSTRCLFIYAEGKTAYCPFKKEEEKEKT